MDKLLGAFKSVIRVPEVVIDNSVFRLHYRITVPILVLFSLLVTSRQHIGDPIDCISKDDIPLRVLDTYCWIHTTFSVESAWFKKVGVEIPYPGVDKYVPGDKRVYHAYYQWVCFVLFLQAMLFYVPRYFWKAMEGGRIKSMVMDLNNPVATAEKRAASKALLVEYLIGNFNNHGSFFYYYYLSEVMNMANVIGQMYLMDAFFNGTFSSFGTEVISFSNWDWTLRYDPLIHLFPRLTKCTFHRFGSSGDVQKHDALCILPINIINEKIYVFLWFWFVILAVLSALSVAYTTFLYFSVNARSMVISSKVNLGKKEDLESVLRKCHVGDWFVIFLLSKNLRSINFRDMIGELAMRFEGKEKNTSEA